MRLPITLDALIREVEDSAPRDVLGQLASAATTAGELGELGDSLLGIFVDRCRRDGRSWSEIGASLGVTKQAVQKRFVAPSPTSAPSLQRFTPRARNVLAGASTLARDFGHDTCDTEHLLLALFDEPAGIAAVVLAGYGASRDGVETAVLAARPRAASHVDGDVPLTPGADRALELTLAAALQLGHNYIGTEHILLGLLSEHDGRGAEFLRSYGVDEQGACAAIVQQLTRYTAADAPWRAAAPWRALPVEQLRP